MKADDIKDCEKDARKGFSYQADFAQTPSQNHWRSRYSDAADGKEWAGNCSDLASTVLDWLCRKGLPLANGYFLAVFDYQSHGGHAVGCAVDDDGRMWIVGDTFALAPYAAEYMRHTPDIYHRLSEPVTAWRKGVPWTIS